MLGQLVAAHRRRLGLTQEELAERAGVSVRAIRNLESGEVRAPRQATVRLLAEAFGLAEDERDEFVEAASEPAMVAEPPPAQLPADVSGFTGRRQELEHLDTLIDDSAGAAVLICALAGTAGVGKTALAVHWAHRARERFPDGQLYVNLRGYHLEQPMTAGDVLARFLEALGVAAGSLPADLEQRAALYRTHVAGRRMLVVLDNAATVEQVRPLLPGVPGCAVLVTSRDSLAGLVARDGARRLDLDLLPQPDALALLRHLVGDRVAAEPDAAAALVGYCDRLPLALRVAAELLVARPAASLADLVGELADQRRRLDVLDPGEDPQTAVRAVFSWSYQQLPRPAGDLFRRLGLHPGDDIDAYSAAALAATGPDQARQALNRLARAHLITVSGPHRHGMHDLLRAYAADLGEEHDTADDRLAAQTRLFDQQLATASAAMDTLYPAERHRRPEITPIPDRTPPVGMAAEALAWLDAERANLVASAAHMAGHGWPEHAYRLSETLFRYLYTGGHHVEALAIHSHARDAAAATGNRGAEAQALHHLGLEYWATGYYQAASTHYERAITGFRAVGDAAGEARAVDNLGNVRWREGDYHAAAEHHERAIELFRAISDTIGEANALGNLGDVHWRLGHDDRAAEHYTRAINLFADAQHYAGQANGLTNLGLVHCRQGRYEAALACHEQALTLFQQTGFRLGEAFATTYMGVVHQQQARYADAVDRHDTAIALFRDSGHRAGETEALNNSGEALQRSGKYHDARDRHATALAIADDTGDRFEQARAHDGLANASLAIGRADLARAHWTQALERYTALGVPEAARTKQHLDKLTRNDDH